jgi:type III secretion system YscD/HrpQ family protein
MAPDNQKLAIRILTGMHRGAELPLSSAVYVLGSGDQCDIILNDPDVEEQHCRLEISGESITLTWMEGGKGLVDGEYSGDKRGALKLFQAVTLGDVNFAIGPAEVQWPAVKTFSFNEEDHQKEQTKATLLVRSKRKKKKERGKLIAIVFLLVCLLGAIIFTVTYKAVRKLHNKRPLVAEVMRAQNTDKVQALIKSMDDSNLSFDIPEDGIPRLSGMVATNDEKVQLISAVRMLFPRSLITLKSAEALEQIIKNSFDIVGYHEIKIKVDVKDKGEVHLSGMVRNREEWLKTLTGIKNDFSRLVLHDDTFSFQKMHDELEKLLGDNNLAYLSFSLTGDVIEIQGPNDPEEQRRAETVIAEFMKKFGDQIKVRMVRGERPVLNADGCSGGLTDPLPFEIVGINGGGIKYLVVKDRGKFFLGSYLPGDIQLMDITDDALKVSYKGCLYNIPFGGIQ